MASVVLLLVVIFSSTAVAGLLVRWVSHSARLETPVSWGRLQMVRLGKWGLWFLVAIPFMASLLGGVYFPEALSRIGQMSIGEFLLLTLSLGILWILFASFVPNSELCSKRELLVGVSAYGTMLVFFGLLIAAQPGQIDSSVYWTGFGVIIVYFIVGQVAVEEADTIGETTAVSLGESKHLAELDRLTMIRPGCTFLWEIVSAKNEHGEIVSRESDFAKGQLDSIAVEKLSPQQLSALASVHDVKLPRKKSWKFGWFHQNTREVIAILVAGFMGGFFFYPSYSESVLGYRNGGLNGLGFIAMFTLVITLFHAMAQPGRHRRAKLRMQAWIDAGEEGESRTPEDYIAALAEAHLALSEQNSEQAVSRLVDGRMWFALRAAETATSGSVLPAVERVLNTDASAEGATP